MEIRECSCTSQAVCRKLAALSTTIVILFDTVMTISGFQIADYMTRERFTDHSLNVQSYKLALARSSMECCGLCSRTPCCKSVCFCHVQNQCFLHNRTVCDTGYSALTPSPGCTYYDTLNHPDDKALSSLCSPSPCQHGGTCLPECPQLKASCSCPHPYYGQFCENRNGNWGSWSAYSQCGGPLCQKTRSRRCNNPPPTGTGSCSGSDISTTDCPTDDGECGDD